MSKSGKSLFSFFAIFVLLALGHDIYVWYNGNGNPFAFAALGWITKTYLPSEHQMVVDALGAETFNMILTPILKIPAFFIAGGITACVLVLDVLNVKIKEMNPGRGKDRDQKFKRYK